jgi:hypothetical protein
LYLPRQHRYNRKVCLLAGYVTVEHPSYTTIPTFLTENLQTLGMRGGLKKYQGKPLQFFHLMTYVLTVILSFLIITGVAIILSQVRTPSYRLQRKNVITLLKMVLNGTASENDWNIFVGIPIRYDPELERVRLQCLVIEQREFLGNSLILTVFVAVYCIDNKYYLLLVAGIYPDKTSIPYLYHKF